MDVWLDEYDRSDLYSDEGPPLGKVARTSTATPLYAFAVWLLRWN